MAQRFSIGLMSSPFVGQPQPQEPTNARWTLLCDKTPCLVAVPTLPFRLETTLAQPAAASSAKCLGMCMHREYLHTRPIQFSFGAESSPRIHRQPPPLHLLPRNLTNRLGPNKVMSRVAAFELFERMFITKHHIVPVLLVLALANRNRPRLWVFDSLEALRCLSACKSRRCIVLCTVE